MRHMISYACQGAIIRVFPMFHCPTDLKPKGKKMEYVEEKYLDQLLGACRKDVTITHRIFGRTEIYKSFKGIVKQENFYFTYEAFKENGFELAFYSALTGYANFEKTEKLTNKKEKK